MTNMSDLPKDLTEDILCRVPATSLKQIRSTCKDWDGLFNDSKFAEKHLDKAPKEFHALILTKDYMLRPLSIHSHGEYSSVEVKTELKLFDPDSTHSYQVDEQRTRIRYEISYQFEVARVFNCEGLLLCTSKDESRIVVWNPCTGQTKWINTGHREERRTFVLGYDQDTSFGRKRYKILSSGRTNGSEIYEFGSNSWRTLENDITPGWSLSHTDICVSLKGDTYAFAKNETPMYGSQILLRFDFATEKFVLVPLPCNCSSYVATSLSVVVREEKLSLLVKFRYECVAHIWVTNKIDETKVVSWTRFVQLDLTGLYIQASHGTTFLVDEEKNVVVLCETLTVEEDEEDKEVTKDMVYILEENGITEVDLGVNTLDLGCPMIFNYVPSLVQIEGGGSNKRKRRE